MRAVITDDSEDIRLLVRVTLEMEGIEVVGEAENGAEAIDLVAAERPDVVVLDLSMPVMTGGEALPILRQESPGSAVVIYSANVTGDDVDELLAAGASAVVMKTDGPRALAREVTAAATTHSL